MAPRPDAETRCRRSFRSESNTVRIRGLRRPIGARGRLRAECVAPRSGPVSKRFRPPTVEDSGSRTSADPDCRGTLGPTARGHLVRGVPVPALRSWLLPESGHRPGRLDVCDMSRPAPRRASRHRSFPQLDHGFRFVRSSSSHIRFRRVPARRRNQVRGVASDPSAGETSRSPLRSLLHDATRKRVVN